MHYAHVERPVLRVKCLPHLKERHVLVHGCFMCSWTRNATLAALVMKIWVLTTPCPNTSNCQGRNLLASKRPVLSNPSHSTCRASSAFSRNSASMKLDFSSLVARQIQMSGNGSQLRMNSRSTVVLPAPAQALIAALDVCPSMQREACCSRVKCWGGKHCRCAGGLSSAGSKKEGRTCIFTISCLIYSACSRKICTRDHGSSCDNEASAPPHGGPRRAALRSSSKSLHACDRLSRGQEVVVARVSTVAV